MVQYLPMLRMESVRLCLRNESLRDQIILQIACVNDKGRNCIGLQDVAFNSTRQNSAWMGSVRR